MRLNVHGQISGRFEPIGKIETKAERQEEFEYFPCFREAHPRAILSSSLPQSDRAFPYRQTRPFFQGLLPEGRALATVAKVLEIESSSYLRILKTMGRECVGAISIADASDEENAPIADGNAYDALDETTLARFAIGDGRVPAELSIQSRLSLAGAQSKVGVRVDRRDDGSHAYSLPRGTSASTHIMKSSSRSFESLSENELYCQRLAKLCGLNVPDAFVDTVRGAPFFVTRRYDRKLDEDGSVLRVHQEDFCQALGRLPEQKYERPGQALVAQIRKCIFESSADPIADTRQIIDLMVFNLAIGNCDGHLKNIAWLRSPDWTSSRLAPFYDLVSTVVYEGLERNLAFRCGTVIKVDSPDRDGLLRMADDVGVGKKALERRVDAICEIVGDAARHEAIALEEELGYEVAKLHSIASFAERQVRMLSV